MPDCCADEAITTGKNEWPMQATAVKIMTFTDVEKNVS